MKKSITLGLLFSGMLFLGSCGKDHAKETTETEKAEKPADALHTLADKAKDLGSRKSVDPVDFRKIKALFPEKIVGLPRNEAGGEKSGAMGFTVSTAEARYKGTSNDKSLHIEIVDTGGIADVTTLALAEWSMAEIDKETQTGYEKTTTINGHKAFEKYDAGSKNGEINLLVADRYIVNVQGQQVSMEDLKEALEELDLDKLSVLK